MKNVFTVSALACLIAACGGGGGSGASSPVTVAQPTLEPWVEPVVTTALPATSTVYTSGTSYFDTSGQSYIEYIAGNAPIVISAPHGGTLAPGAIPNRADNSMNAGCPSGATIVTVVDTNTRDLASKIQSNFFARYGVRPHVILASIARTKVDLNRDKPEAACGNVIAETAWADYHRFINDAIATAAAQHGKVLYMDIHGHGHTKQRFEMGYLFSASALRSFVSTPTYTNTGNFSLKNLPRYQNNAVTVRELLYGASAFGTFAANRAVPAVPSAQDTAPDSADDYFNGGFNTWRYTGVSYPNVFGWQIETNGNSRSSNAARDVTSIAIADSVVAFLKTHHATFTGTVGWTVPAAQ